MSFLPRSFSSTFLIMALLGLPLVAAGQPAADAATLGTRIESGSRRASGRSVRYGHARGVVEAPIEQVMRVVTDYPHYQEFLPYFRQSRVLSRRGNNALVYMQARVLGDTTTLWCQMRIYARPNRGETRIIEGRMTEGNMDAFVARWEVSPVSRTRTMVTFELLLDPDLPFPSSLVTAQNVRSARHTVQGLRRQVLLPRYASP